MLTLKLFTLFILYGVEESAQTGLFNECRNRRQNISYNKAVQNRSQYREEGKNCAQYLVYSGKSQEKDYCGGNNKQTL